ncbi:ADYC domain-containing protein [Stigmatella sp. ncwal1]|uniref:ADYC domain-containing protein n=1 Tax=Stigmatella ashevillensis TaxID=2995309 RepID=A0ABT5DFQ1_9BACT|nr:ADYC domain-containing protein [Stigmatella ashevillena]MDC0711181.1 ADYC domain-containing protein [Stigmatella ashevillena]
MGARHVVAAALGMWVTVGCGTEGVEDTAPATVGGVVAGLAAANGPTLNGRNVNGRNVNGPWMNQMLVSVRYEGAVREGMGLPMKALWLEGSALHGVGRGEELSGQDLVKLHLVGNLEDGSTLPLRIDGVTQGSGVDQDVWSYDVSFQDTKTGAWHPICTTADGAALKAIPLEGTWNYKQGVEGGGSKIHDNTVFTFACDGAALAKCVRFGYKPWQSVEGVSLEEHHQACTRLIRADFCGDGTSYTQDGNWVNLYDTQSVQTDSEPWVAEAEWTSQGASCFTSHTRATEPVQCADGRQVSTCGERFSPNTLIISETPPSAQP